MKTPKIIKADFDPELQRAYGSGKIIASFKYSRWRIRLFNALTDLSFKGKKRPGVVTEHMSIESREGFHDIPLVIYKPIEINRPLPVMLYMHGGGYVSGSPEMSPGLEDLMTKRPCIIVAPRYRRALDAPYPAALDDCYDTLLWIKKHAAKIEGNGKVIIAGHSAGGGLAAAVTLKNRDEKDVDVAFQMPCYPMLDYRNNSPVFNDIPVWNTKSNTKSWAYYLKGLNDLNQPIPSYASPALNADYSEFPPTISFVGELEPFRDEVIEYINAIQEANIDTRFKLFPKAFHAFEAVVPEAQISKEAQQFLLDAYAEFYDKYC